MQVKHNMIQGHKNITSDPCNIKRHLTGAQKIIIFSFVIITISLLNITHTSALTYQDEIDMQFTFNPTVQIAVSGDLIIPDLAPGSSSDSNIITVTAGSNDTHGYTLYGTVGSSTNNYTDLRLSSSNTTNVFTNLSSNKATLSNFSDNTWGYSYSTDSGSSWVSGNAGSTSSGYNGLPLYNSSNNASGVILASTSSASETSLQFKIGAKAASTQVSGTYTNTINFIGVGNVVTTTYSLNYVDASGEGTGLPTNLSSQTTNDGVITLSETTPTRDGYIFKGWCDTNNSSDPTTCTGNTYNPGRIYIIPVASQGGTVNVNLYAVWQSASSAATLADITNMQDSFSCADTPAGTTNTLTDIRDGKSYTVAKLADGNCWMTQNLDFNIVDAGVDLDSTNTDVPSNWGDAGNLTDTYATSDTTWEYSHNTPESYDPGDLCWNGAIYSNYSGELSNSTVTCGDDKHYSIGNYYNWTAAVAMSDSSSYTSDGTDVDQSICPAGWRLPTYSGSKSYDTLVSTLSLTAGTSGNIQSSPVYFVYGGHWEGSSSLVGGGGLYWSSVVGDVDPAYDEYLAYDLYFYDSGHLYPQGDDYRSSGISVRCVAR